MRFAPLRQHTEYERYGAIWGHQIAGGLAHLAIKLVSNFRLMWGETPLLTIESELSEPQQDGELEAYGTCECPRYGSPSLEPLARL